VKKEKVRMKCEGTRKEKEGRGVGRVGKRDIVGSQITV